LSLAIIWPANPRAVVLHEEGDPETHIELLRNRAAIFWDSMPRRRELETPLNGYIYFNRAVRYRCRVECMISRDTLLHKREEHQYIPSFRRQCLFGVWESGEPHPPSETWIKILQIERLDPPLQIATLSKVNGQPLRAVVGGVAYIRDPMP